MVKQGFLGALEQYWSVEPKVRLHRRNSWVKDNSPQLSEREILYGLILVCTIVVLFIIFVMLGAIF